MLLAGVLECLLSEGHSSISSGPRIEGSGLESVLTLTLVASKGGRSLKVVDPSAACQEKIVSPTAHCDIAMTIVKVLKLRLRDGKKCGIEPFLGRFRVF